jgi:hypothetical protein
MLSQISKIKEKMFIMLNGLHQGFLTWPDWKYFFELNDLFDVSLDQ